MPAVWPWAESNEHLRLADPIVRRFDLPEFELPLGRADGDAEPLGGMRAATVILTSSAKMAACSNIPSGTLPRSELTSAAATCCGSCGSSPFDGCSGGYCMPLSSQRRHDRLSVPYRTMEGIVGLHAYLPTTWDLTSQIWRAVCTRGGNGR